MRLAQLSAVSERLTIEVELREALQAGQLRLVYQPIVHIASNTPHGVEALLRWTEANNERVPHHCPDPRGPGPAPAAGGHR